MARRSKRSSGAGVREQQQDTRSPLASSSSAAPGEEATAATPHAGGGPGTAADPASAAAVEVSQSGSAKRKSSPYVSSHRVAAAAAARSMLAAELPGERQAAAAAAPSGASSGVQLVAASAEPGLQQTQANDFPRTSGAPAAGAATQHINGVSKSSGTARHPPACTRSSKGSRHAGQMSTSAAKSSNKECYSSSKECYGSNKEGSSSNERYSSKKEDSTNHTASSSLKHCRSGSTAGEASSSAEAELLPDSSTALSLSRADSCTALHLSGVSAKQQLACEIPRRQDEQQQDQLDEQLVTQTADSVDPPRLNRAAWGMQDDQEANDSSCSDENRERNRNCSNRCDFFTDGNCQRRRNRSKKMRLADLRYPWDMRNGCTQTSQQLLMDEEEAAATAGASTPHTRNGRSPQQQRRPGSGGRGSCGGSAEALQLLQEFDSSGGERATAGKICNSSSSTCNSSSGCCSRSHTRRGSSNNSNAESSEWKGAAAPSSSASGALRSSSRSRRELQLRNCTPKETPVLPFLASRATRGGGGEFASAGAAAAVTCSSPGATAPAVDAATGRRASASSVWHQCGRSSEHRNSKGDVKNSSTSAAAAAVAQQQQGWAGGEEEHASLLAGGRGVCGQRQQSCSSSNSLTPATANCCTASSTRSCWAYSGEDRPAAAVAATASGVESDGWRRRSSSSSRNTCCSGSLRFFQNKGGGGGQPSGGAGLLLRCCSSSSSGEGEGAAGGGTEEGSSSSPEPAEQEEPRRRSVGSQRARQKLLTASAVCCVFMVVEVVAGFAANSLALMTDASHLLSDLCAFLISLFALWVSELRGNPSMSFGYHRAEILGALLSVILIWLLTAFLLYAACGRFFSPPAVDGRLMFGTAFFGTLANLFMTHILQVHSHGIGHVHAHAHSPRASADVGAATAAVEGSAGSPRAALLLPPGSPPTTAATADGLLAGVDGAAASLEFCRKKSGFLGCCGGGGCAGSRLQVPAGGTRRKSPHMHALPPISPPASPATRLLQHQQQQQQQMQRHLQPHQEEMVVLASNREQQNCVGESDAAAKNAGAGTDGALTSTAAETARTGVDTMTTHGVEPHHQQLEPVVRGGSDGGEGGCVRRFDCPKSGGAAAAGSEEREARDGWPRQQQQQAGAHCAHHHGSSTAAAFGAAGAPAKRDAAHALQLQEAATRQQQQHELGEKPFGGCVKATAGGKAAAFSCRGSSSSTLQQLFAEGRSMLHQHQHVRPCSGASAGSSLLTNDVYVRLEEHEHDVEREYESMNLRAAYIHALGDLLQNIGVMVASAVIWWKPEWSVADPVCTFVFSIFVLLTTISILREALNVLMEGTPLGVDARALQEDLLQIPGVVEVHDLHVWSLSVGHPSLACHLVVATEDTARTVLRRATLLCQRKYRILHTTIQTDFSSDKRCCDTAAHQKCSRPMKALIIESV